MESGLAQFVRRDESGNPSTEDGDLHALARIQRQVDYRSRGAHTRQQPERLHGRKCSAVTASESNLRQKVTSCVRHNLALPFSRVFLVLQIGDMFMALNWAVR
jgi:hypothetical protein